MNDHMKVLCLSASNIEPARQHSASTCTCEIIRDLIESESTARIEILHLLDYEMTPCRMCGECTKTGQCMRDDSFNEIQR